MSDTTNALIIFNLGGDGHDNACRSFRQKFANDALSMTYELMTIISSPSSHLQQTINMTFSQHSDTLNPALYSAVTPVGLKSIAILLLNQEIAKGEDPLILSFPKDNQLEIQHQLLELLQDPNNQPIHRVLCVTITTIANLQLGEGDNGWPELLQTIFSWLQQHGNEPIAPSPNGAELNSQIEASLFHNALYLLTEITATRFDAIITFIPLITQLLGAIFFPSNDQSTMLTTLPTKVKACLLIQRLVDQPEIDTKQFDYFHAITTTLSQSLQTNSLRYTKLILGSLVEIVTEGHEVDFFKPHMVELVNCLSPIALGPTTPEDVSELVLELLVSLVELRPQFANGVATTSTNPFSKKKTTVAAANGPTPSVLLTQILFKITTFFMTSISCDEEWCQLSPIDKDSNNGDEDDYYQNQEQHHHAGLYGFSRFVSQLTTKRLKEYIIPDLIMSLSLPSLPLTELPQPPQIANNLIDDQYNVNWKSHMIALRLFIQFANPAIISLQNLPMSQIFTLLTSSHPRVQYAALGAILTLATEYHSDLALLCIGPLLSAIPTLLQQNHLPHIQQMVCTCFQVVLSEVLNIDQSNDDDNINTESDSFDDIDGSPALSPSRVAVLEKLNAIFTVENFNSLLSYLFNTFNHYHNDPTLSPKTIGIQINLITCIAELAHVSPLTFIPHFTATQACLMPILQENLTNSTDLVYLQCKVIEALTYIYDTLNNFAQILPKYPPSLLPADPTSLPSPNGPFPFNLIQFSDFITTQALDCAKMIKMYYDFITTLPQLKDDYNLVLKYALRGLTRLCPILQLQFKSLIKFVMDHIIIQLKQSIMTKTHHNMLKSSSDATFTHLMPGGQGETNRAVDTRATTLHPLLSGLPDEFHNLSLSTESNQSSLNQMAMMMTRGPNNDGNDMTVAITARRVEAEQLELFYDDVSASLSMLQRYISELPILMVPWVYDITGILLYYVNYPQNTAIQTMVGVMIPSFIKMLSQTIISTGITSLPSPSQSTTNWAYNNNNNSIGNVDLNNIMAYQCYLVHSDFFSQFTQEQQHYSQYQQQHPKYQTQPFFYIPSDPNNGNDVGNNVLKTDGTRDIFNIRDNLGLRFVLPSIQQLARTIMYIFEYLLYILKLEIDDNIIQTLLSSLALGCDEVDGYIYGVTNYHILAVILDYVLMLSYNSQDKISKSILNLFSRLNKTRNNVNSSNNDSDDSDEEEDDDDNDDDDDDNNNNETNDGESDVATPRTKKHYKNDFVSILIPPEQFDNCVSSQYSAKLYSLYQQYPFDEVALHGFTKLNDFISEQLIMIINRVLILCNKGNCLTTPTNGNNTNSSSHSIAHLLPRFDHFATILLRTAPSQHPSAKAEAEGYANVQRVRMAALGGINGQNQQNLIPPHHQYLAQTYTLRIQKLPFMLYHSFFNAYKTDLAQLAFVSESNNVHNGNNNNNQNELSTFLLLQKFVQFSSLILSQTSTLTSIYLATFDYIKTNGATVFHPIMGSALDQMEINKDKSFYIKLLHNQNPGILLEHLSYSLGLFVEFLSTHHHPQMAEVLFGGEFFNNIPQLHSVLCNQQQQQGLLTHVSLIENLGHLNTLLRQYFNVRFKLTSTSLQSYILPPTIQQLTNLFTTQPLQQFQSKQAQSQQQNINRLLPIDSSYSNDFTSAVTMTTFCEIFAYGCDNTVMCYLRWVLGGLHMLTRSSQQQQQQQQHTISSLTPQQSQNGNFLIGHLVTIMLYFAPLVRDMSELSIMYQLVANYIFTNSMDQTVEDLELLLELSFPSPRTAKLLSDAYHQKQHQQQQHNGQNVGMEAPLIQLERTQTINDWRQKNLLFESNYNNLANPTLLTLFQHFSPFQSQLSSSTTSIQPTLTLLYPLLSFLAKGFLIPDLNPTTRSSICAVMNLIVAPYLTTHASLHSLSYNNPPSFLPSVLLSKLDLTGFNKSQYDLICKGFHSIIDPSNQSIIPYDQHPAIQSFYQRLNPVAVSDVDCYLVESTIKHLVTHFYGVGSWSLLVNGE